MTIDMILMFYRYDYVEFNPAFHLDNFWGHLYHLLTQVYNSLHVRYIQLSESEKKEVGTSK
jgi:hypothetical protein